MNIDDILDNYNNELKNEININKLNLSDHQVKLPSLKHKWASRYINHKKTILKLKSKKKQLIKTLTAKYIDNSPVKINLNVAEKAINNSKEVFSIDENIAQQELIVEYLERVQNIVNSIQWDIKNLIELEKLELQ